MREFVAVFGLVLVFLLTNLVPNAQARPVHFFDCKDCHTASVDLFSLGNSNLCLKCHKDTPLAVTFNDLSPGNIANGLFHPNEASDAIGSATAAGQAPTQQTSHFWAAKKDAVPTAGALAPSKTLYTSRYGISTGKVTCTRCHDPHLPIETDPKLLRMTEAGDLICLDCHRPWKLSNNRGRETHPVVADYAAVATANPTKYNASVTNVGSGGVKLMSGGVSCSSCHSVHFADSHSGTLDGRNNRAGLQPGDGKLLRTDGPKRNGATAADTAQLRSNLCQACHTYKTHGSSNPIGCLDCHSGHVYNNGDPNFFVLRASIASVYVPKNSAVGAVGSIQFKTASAEWMNAGGSGYCQSCHNLGANHNGFTAGNGIATSCGECHYHDHADRSFTASCNGCHGTPPTANSPAPAVGGYAKSGSYDYSASPFFKNESLTPHGSHAGGSDYRFACDVCHLGKSHATGTFQDVLKSGTIHALASGSGRTAPTYAGAGSGTCSAVYCHSNGGARAAAPVAAPGSEWGNGAWANGKDVISGKLPAARCQSCHGNDSASMSARSNSVSHQKHLAKGYGCNVCHLNTASSSTVLASGAIGTTHVNGSADVSYDNNYELSVGRPLGTGSYASGAGTCSIYCHSNGQGLNASPDWDLAATGACGSCHAARVGDVAVIASGSHSKHVSDVNGPQLGCDACHGASANSGSHAGHVNGMVNAPAASICTSCHAVDAGETTPVWGNSGTSTCESCHSGATVSTINSKTAPSKPLAASSGHNKPSGTYTLSGNSAANRACVACHDASAAGHFGASGDSRLSGGFSCSSCHATVLTHQAKSCTACHDPHGSSNGYMIYSSQTTQNAKDASASGKFSGNVVFTAKTGADSYEELDAGAGVNGDDLCASCHSSATGTSHNNRQVSGAAHNEGTNCTSCHSHTKAFRPVGTACNQCHGNAPATGAHAFHAIVVDHTTAEDRTDCAVCHLGADSYTYDPSADIVGGLNHSDPAGRKTKLTTAVGFSVANQTCASACHESTLTDGAWADADGLNCDSCHYWSATPTLVGNNAYTNASGAAAPLGAKHSKHFALSMVCGDCHGTVTTDLTFKRGHNNFKTAATDADKIRYQGYQQLNPNGTGVNVDDSSYNAAVNSWVNSAVTNDGGNTCANTACHNPSATTYKADWDVDAASCSLCHSDTDPATGAHGKHLSSRGAAYGGTVICTTCHVDNGVNMAHRNGTVNMRLAGGSPCHACHSLPGGACTGCHFGTLSAIWVKTGVVTGCGSCHAQSPTSNDHTVHISGTYGPLLGTDCSACHQSQANNTSMSGFSTHMNFTATFRNRAVPASPYEVSFTTIGQAASDGVDSCNACHGGASAALIAKDNWTIATRVSCESCHGNYSAASRNADGSGVAAPIRAGAAFTSYGHGKVTTNPTYGGKQCLDCHSNTAAHISGSLGDAKRLKVINSKNFQTPGQENDFCGVCHAFAAKTHFANSLTSGGASLDGNYCFNCHDVHGQNGSQDAMLRSNIGGRIVTGFSSKAARSSYFVITPNNGGNNQYGICQVCHDPTEVSYFNTTTSSDAGHNPGQLCTNCHKHENASGAFRATCSSCHGGGTTGASSSNYWPDGTTGHAANQSGRHVKHVTALAQKLFNENLTQLLTSNTTGNPTLSADVKQKRVCAYCHEDPAGASFGTLHANATTNVQGYLHSMWQSYSTDFASTDSNAIWTVGNGTCATTDCHNNTTTTAGTYGWYNAGLSTCTMCHVVGGANTATMANPASGLHNVTPSVSGKKHDDTLHASGCVACHSGALTAHWDGTAQGGNGQKTQMGLPAFYTQTADNTGSCATTVCHMGFSDDWAHKWDSTATYYTNATTACAGCHGDWANTWNAGTIHRTSANAQSMHGGAGTYKCLDCHALGTANYPFTFGTADWAPLNAGNKHGNNQIDVNSNGVTYNAASGLCTTCHAVSDGVHNFLDTSWTITSLSGNPIAVACGACHTGGVQISSASGAHTKHNAGTGALIAGGASCTSCHGNNGGLGYQSTLAGTHGTGSVTFAVTYSQAASRGNLTGSCSNASCHYSQATPVWNATFPASPAKCTKCHNSGSDSGTIAGAWPSKNQNGTARSDAHSGHLATSMITLGANCTDCHGNNTVTHSNAFDGSAVVGGAKLSAYSSAAGTCTNSCHGGTAGADFRDKAPTVVCLDCHAGSYIGNFVTTASSHVDADGAGGTYTSSQCEACHGTASNAYRSAHADNTAGVNDVEIPTTYGGGTPVPTMNRQYASTFSKIRLGGTATSGYAKSTEAEICWSCHDGVTSSLYTLSAVNVTFTAPATIAATGIGTKFVVGRWITINGSSNIANNRTFRVATSSVNSITVTIPTGASNLVSVASAAGITIVSPVSEFGVNQSADTGNLDYDYGYLYTNTTKPGTMTSNWVTAIWRSGKGRLNDALNPFLYKEGAVQSTHAANFGGTFTAVVTNGNSLGFNRTETPDAVANIRCSYCHDVHGTHNGINGDVSTGKPYLRGTWKGNPYPEDGAPRTGMTSWAREGTNDDFGLVPRGSASRSNSGLTTVPKAGGYWIDQNTDNPNSGQTSTATAGLCDQCHGSTKDGTWTNAELAVINEVTTGNEASNALWVSGYNGHSNVVLKGQAADTAGPGRGANGSAESYARNIFTRTKRGSATKTGSGSNVNEFVDMGLATFSSGRAYSFRSNDSGGYQYYPRIGSGTTTGTGTSQPYAYQNFAWSQTYQTQGTTTHELSAGTVNLEIGGLTAKSDSGATESATVNAQANYHTFNCAKCHNPHASRLPKLMITNCLDTNHNSWDNDYQAGTSTSIDVIWRNTRMSQWPSAQNCHRLDNRASMSTGQSIQRGSGWNKATPWLETTTPD